MIRKNLYKYITIFNYAEDGINIYFPDLPGCFSCADTYKEAIKNAKEAMGLHLWSMEKDNDFIPKPSSLKNIKLKNNEVAKTIKLFMPLVRKRINKNN